MIGYGQTGTVRNTIFSSIKLALTQRSEQLNRVSGNYFERIVASVLLGMEAREFEEKSFARLLEISRLVGSYTELIESLDEPKFELGMREFEGMI